ncbi:DNA topoisomerase [Insolitispirillum peregrinum]|uniref:DNA topoisomerase n=1 Tax=Insolitispirillum peregrinum TaxID=80876 RepID=A0A1N7MGY6_9PROT|nr:DNA topoisomerase [Insolitispirillum peregrinum]SIS85251.1 DNA topoisomerase-3 [Insolitispirillum peregrinum]
MRLIIAEKPAVAAAIAAAFGGGSKTASAYRLPNGDAVSWLYGHIIRLGEPDEHDEKYKRWSLADLPIRWPVKLYLQPEHKAHYEAIVALAQQADELVHAGDPDPEGQRLVDEVIEYAGLTDKPCKRVLINDNNPGPIRAAFQAMRDNADYQPLSLSALARAVSDQRYGFNMTRACTLAARAKGVDGVLSVGRVQTPILGLVVARDKAHEGHTKSHYYTVKATLSVGGQEVAATCQPGKDDPVDDKGRLTNPAVAQAMVNSLRGQTTTVQVATTTARQQAAPLPYNLLALQADAAGAYRYSPKQVMEITQSLRDKHNAITYNRSDCRYLNGERHAEAPALLAALAGAFGELVAGATPTLRSKAFDSSKVTAHHAIIPTERVPDLAALSKDEARIYQMIVRQYVAQFYPPEQWRSTEVVFSANGHTLKATGRVDVAAGWRLLYGKEEVDAAEDDQEGSSNNLEALKRGNQGVVKDAASQQGTTKPPPRYTMKTLLQDLTKVSKYVTDPKIRALLLAKDADKQDEAGGIGTPATRDSHIETLFKRGFVEEKGAALVSTKLGRSFHDALPDLAVKPDLTALWDEQQRQIEAGVMDFRTVIKGVDATIAAEVARIKEHGLSITSTAPLCPVCGKGHLRKRSSSKGDFWACSAYPACKATYPDTKGKPDLSPRKATSKHKPGKAVAS